VHPTLNRNKTTDNAYGENLLGSSLGGVTVLSLVESVSGVESVNSLEQELSLVIRDTLKGVDNFGQSVYFLLYGLFSKNSTTGLFSRVMTGVSNIEIEYSSVSLLSLLFSGSN